MWSFAYGLLYGSRSKHKLCCMVVSRYVMRFSSVVIHKFSTEDNKALYDSHAKKSKLLSQRHLHDHCLFYTVYSEAYKF